MSVWQHVRAVAGEAAPWAALVGYVRHGAHVHQCMPRALIDHCGLQRARAVHAARARLRVSEENDALLVVF